MHCRIRASALVACACLPGLPLVVAAATEPLTQPPTTDGDADAFYGSYRQTVAIAVPGYHGLEPHLQLRYDSGGGNGLAGVGWALGGFSVIERASPGGGAPRFNDSDIFLLDG